MIPVLYLTVITGAEVLTIISPLFGLTLYGLLLLVLPLHAYLMPYHSSTPVLVCLLLVPLTRMLSLTLPLADLPVIYWFLVISIPRFAATFLVIRALGYSLPGLGLNFRRPLFQLTIASAALPLGLGEYAILQPVPLVTRLTLDQLWLPAFILLVTTGFGEELIFRGVLQRAVTESLGPLGVLYTTLLFAVMHLGQLSVGNVVFVFLAGLFFGLAVARTGSLWGVTVAHGLLNVFLYLVFPFWF